MKNQIAKKTPALAPKEAAKETVASALDEIFGGSRTTFELSTGETVQFKKAKLLQIAVITEFMEKLIQNVEPSQLMSLIDTISVEQAALLNAGKSHEDMRINATRIIEKALGYQSMLLSFVSKFARELPPVMACFCDLTEEQISDLELDDVCGVAAGVVGVNYSFFSQRLPLIFKAVYAGWATKSRQTNTSVTSTGG